MIGSMWRHRNRWEHDEHGRVLRVAHTHTQEEQNKNERRSSCASSRTHNIQYIRSCQSHTHTYYIYAYKIYTPVWTLLHHMVSIFFCKLNESDKEEPQTPSVLRRGHISRDLEIWLCYTLLRWMCKIFVDVPWLPSSLRQFQVRFQSLTSLLVLWYLVSLGLLGTSDLKGIWRWSGRSHDLKCTEGGNLQNISSWIYNVWATCSCREHFRVIFCLGSQSPSNLWMYYDVPTLTPHTLPLCLRPALIPVYSNQPFIGHSLMPLR